MIRFILLDIHGVLTDGKERKRFMKFMKKKHGVDSEKHNKLWVEHLKNLDTAKEISSHYINEFNKMFGAKFSINKYYGIFTDQIKINNIFLRNIGMLKGVKLCIVSDNFYSIASRLKKKFIGVKFYRKYYSYKIGTTKAQQEFFDFVLRDLRADPRECLFIDDNENNVKIAEEAGINSIVFRNSAQAIAEIKEKIYPIQL